jgi:hypothetical protein
VRAGLEADAAIERVIFCCFSARDRETYDRLARELLA